MDEDLRRNLMITSWFGFVISFMSGIVIFEKYQELGFALVVASGVAFIMSVMFGLLEKR